MSRQEGGYVIAKLNGLGGSLQAAIAGLDEAALSWRPAENKWSVREVIAHLADLESEVFAVRLRQVLDEDLPLMKAIDPDARARDFGYQGQDVQGNIRRLLEARAQNIRLIQPAPPEAWDRVGVHERRGPMSFREIVEGMANHDQNHLRQIGEVIRARAERGS